MASVTKKYSIKILYLLSFLLISLSLTSCFDDFDDVIHQPSNLEIKNFVYRGMKQFYLYKSEDQVLGDHYFSDPEALKNYLHTFDSPEDLFHSLLSPKDRFSVIVPNFHKLEKELNGITLNNGMEFGLVRISGTDQVFGYVRYVLPNTSASQQGIQRGMLFNRIDGTLLNISNYRDLLKPQSYTVGLASLAGTTLTSLPTVFELTKTEYSEDPVFIHRVIDTAGHHIGYLMYNGFIPSFNHELNAAFGDFKADGVTDLVVDLRYNPGGSIATCKALASMITGQYQGQLFATEVFNDNFADQALNFGNQLADGTPINSLRLNKVYVITSLSTASASELLINGLNAYVDLIQVGETTVGKYQGSITVYDSPDFTRATVKPGHTYAMQPLVLKTVNADGFTDFADGLPPDIHQSENFNHLGRLGTPEEPLLHTVIGQIVGQNTAALAPRPSGQFTPIGGSKMQHISYRRMYQNSL